MQTSPLIRHLSRAELLSRVTVKKASTPGLREVFLDGVLVGRILANPFGMGWLASCVRYRCWWSIDDAALALVEDSTARGSP